MKELLTDFYAILDQKIREVWSKTDSKEHLLALAEGIQTLGAIVIQIGFESVEADDEEKLVSRMDTIHQIFIHYNWIPVAKSFLVLWRDVIFQYQKGMILRLEDQTTESDLHELSEQSYKKIVEASSYLKNYFETGISGVAEPKKNRAEYLGQRSLQTNPWPTYKEQLIAITEQGPSLLDKYEKVAKTAKDLGKLRDQIGDVISSFESEIERIRIAGAETIDIINEDKSDGQQKLIEHADIVGQQALAINYFNSYKDIVDQVTSQMIDNVEVPIGLIESQLQVKEIDFGLSTRLWLQREIQPLILEAQEIIDAIGNSMKMAFINIKNRASILSVNYAEGSQELFNRSEYSQPILRLIDTIEQKNPVLLEYTNQVSLRMEEKLRIGHIYHGNSSFLDSNQLYLLDQLKFDQSAWLQKIRNWVMKRAGIARGLLANIAKEESLSISEKIVRFTQSRKIKENNQAYANIFSTQGYIGESFWVGRQDERTHMIHLIDSWKSGLRGSVIVKGKRFCGKTVFGELICHRHFPDKTIRLKPYSVLRLHGNSMAIEDDIGVALDFIKKHTVGQKFLVWIDDLELWQNTKITASRNVQTLTKQIDALSSQVFFMVSMSNWFEHFYNKMFDIKKVFQGEINLDYMPEEEIRQAILIRHGATHKVLVDEENKQVHSRDFGRMVHQINQLAGNNVGQALNLWSYFTECVNEEMVIHRPELSYQLPDFINEENGILLRTILMDKLTNEYRLRKTLGIAFRDKYNATVQRMLGLGILTRHMDGLLEIDGGVVNDIAALLHEARYIKYTP